jgi:hypothetical protein
LQIIISTGQVYGDVLYYATSLLDESYCRPEGYYFWFYYFFFNFIWMVVGCCEYFYDYDMIFWVAIDVYQIMLKRVLSRFGGRLRSFRRLRLRGKMIDLMKGLSRWGLDLQLHRTMQTIIMYDRRTENMYSTDPLKPEWYYPAEQRENNHTDLQTSD